MTEFIETLIEVVIALALFGVLTHAVAVAAADPNASAGSVALLGIVDLLYIALVVFAMYRKFKKGKA